MDGRPSHHFLVVSFPAQGHINPTLQLAKCFARLGARVTFSTSVSAQRRLFPSTSPQPTPPPPPSDGEVAPPPLLCYSPYSIGEYDDNPVWDSIDQHHFMSQLKSVGSRTLAELARDLAEAGCPVTCVVYDCLVPWAADVARDLGLPSSVYWIQPATVFGVYYHYFHGHADLVASLREEPFSPVDLPGLPPLRIRDLPSHLVSKSRDDGVFLPALKELFRCLDRHICESAAAAEEEEGKKGRSELRVLVNTFDALEHDALIRAVDAMELVPVGPTLPSAYTDGVDGADTAFGSDLFQPDAKDRYTGWLDSKAEKSVVYVSFGSFSVLSARQREEICLALEGSGRPYLWVARGNREGVVEGERGMVVEWCSQMEVLSHRAVGCFVTHCGWNSTLESLACGVPTVGLPQWTDQATNARLAEASWGTGVRAEANAEGLLEAVELRRCLDLVMGEGERGEEIRRNAAAWREKARKAVKQGGSSDRNLRAFVLQVHAPMLSACD